MKKFLTMSPIADLNFIVLIYSILFFMVKCSY